VIMFGPSDSEVWGPWRTPAEILKSQGSIESISAAEAIGAVERVLTTARVHTS
jgi:hypothetical protein